MRDYINASLRATAPGVALELAVFGVLLGSLGSMLSPNSPRPPVTPTTGWIRVIGWI